MNIKPHIFLRSLIYTIIFVIWLMVIGITFYIPSYISQWRHEKVINVLSWGGIFDAQTLSEFYKRTGIKVNVSFYTTNEELLVNLRATGGRDYDLIVPSDYAVKMLKKHKLLKKIKKEKLTFLTKLSPILLGHSYDPHNDYCLPYMWEVFGLGYNKEYFKSSLINSSWSFIFTDPKVYKIAMVNDPIEAVCLAGYYLYGNARTTLVTLTPPAAEKVKELLINQRNWVEAYTDFRPDYLLLTDNCPLVVCSFSSIMRAIRQSPSIEFTLPQERTFISIENVALTCPCSHRSCSKTLCEKREREREDMVYEFINYIYNPEVMKRHFDTLASLPAMQDVLHDVPLIPSIKKLLTLSREEFETYALFFAPLMTESALHDLWIDIKSR